MKLMNKQTMIISHKININLTLKIQFDIEALLVLH
jgi:hypothetical protein